MILGKWVENTSYLKLLFNKKMLKYNHLNYKQLSIGNFTLKLTDTSNNHFFFFLV